MNRSTAAGTRESLMQVAEALLRSKGYAAFSYADLAQVVGIRKASIHHHFPAKEDLGLAVVQDYVARMEQEHAAICAQHPLARARLEAYVQWFMQSARSGQLPLCGALAAEMAALPERLQALTRHFFRLQLQWLQSVLEAGVAAGQLPAHIHAAAAARQILGLLEGSNLIHWALGDDSALDMRALLRMIGIGEEAADTASLAAAA